MKNQYDIPGAARVFWRDLILRCVVIAGAVFFIGATIGAVYLSVRG